MSTMLMILMWVVLWTLNGSLGAALCLGDFHRLEQSFVPYGCPKDGPPWPLVIQVAALGPVGLLSALSASKRPYIFRWRGW